MKIKSIISIMLLLGLFYLSSCKTTNLFEATNYANLDSLSKASASMQLYRIKTDDKISVSIWNHDDLSVGSVFGIYNSNEVYGKWVMVNQIGEISLPEVGTVNVKGLTIHEAEKMLSEKYAKFIVKPTIVVKVLNREITVLGEVRKPGKIILEKEMTSVVEILAEAGGLDYYADKKNIKLIRGTKNGPVQFDLNLTKKNDFIAQTLPVQSGDVLYIPAKNGKASDKKITYLLPIASIVTALAVVGALLIN